MLVVAMLVAVLTVAAHADTTVTLQNGLDGYTGCADVMLNQSPSSNQAYGYGGTDTSYTYSGTSESELFLVKFDLAPLQARGPVSILDAKLKLYCYNNSYGGPTRAQQLGMDWTEGTGSHYSHSCDGAGHRNRHELVSVTNDPDYSWTLDTDPNNTNNLYKVHVPSGIIDDPRFGGDHTYCIRRGYTDRLRWYDYTRDAGEDYDSKANLDAAASGFSNGFAYWYDSANSDLYVQMQDGSSPTAIYFIEGDNSWDWNSRLAAGYWETQIDGPTAPAWHEFDVTEMVQKWMGLDGEPLTANYGLQFDAVNKYSNGRRYYLSEYADDASLRPILEVEYVPPVAEPAGLSLLGLTLLGLKRRKRS
jgi:hypothetical protein